MATLSAPPKLLVEVIAMFTNGAWSPPSAAWPSEPGAHYVTRMRDGELITEIHRPDPTFVAPPVADLDIQTRCPRCGQTTWGTAPCLDCLTIEQTTLYRDNPDLAAQRLANLKQGK